MIAPHDPSRRPYSLVLDVDPPQAFRWLEGNTHNRPVNQLHVERLARDMVADRWRLTHQGIAFDNTGLLIDGQHRLWAIIQANVTVKLRVFFNEPTENRHVLDTGERRTNLDVLNITGEVGEVTNMLLATLRFMLTGLTTRIKRHTPGEEAAHLARHRGALDYAVEHFGRAPARGVATSEVRAVVARAFYLGEHERLGHFCDVLRSGLSTGASDYVIVALRDFLVQPHRAEKAEASRRMRYAKTEWALASFLEGRQPKRLCVSTCELFPLPEEVDRPSQPASDNAA